MPSTNTDHARLRWIQLHPTERALDPGTQVINGLRATPKTLPCRYFYDDHGSDLFEQICDQPEYYPTRTEQYILETYAPEIADLTGACELVELGSGSSRKTRVLLEAYDQMNHSLHYCPIDVSAGILRSTAIDLLDCYPNLQLCGLAGTYEQALAQLPPPQLDNRMVIFLGSTMGNLCDTAASSHGISEQDQFLQRVQQALRPGEFFLLGVDLQKPIEILEAAYNDANGITAAFNLNILQHLNHRYQANFDLDQFQHWAFYNTQAHRIEMHLRSFCLQSVTLGALKYTLELQAGETIRTEISRKFSLPTLSDTLESYALKPLKTWTDPQSWFALLLCQRQCLEGECP